MREPLKVANLIKKNNFENFQFFLFSIRRTIVSKGDSTKVPQRIFSLSILITMEPARFCPGCQLDRIGDGARVIEDCKYCPVREGPQRFNHEDPRVSCLKETSFPIGIILVLCSVIPGSCGALNAEVL